MIENTYKVPKSQWKKWPELAQRVFNSTYYIMKENQTIFLHPKTDWTFQDQWNTTAWNAAWTAADEVKVNMNLMVPADA